MNPEVYACLVGRKVQSTKMRHNQQELISRKEEKRGREKLGKLEKSGK